MKIEQRCILHSKVPPLLVLANRLAWPAMNVVDESFAATESSRSAGYVETLASCAIEQQPNSLVVQRKVICERYSCV